MAVVAFAVCGFSQDFTAPYAPKINGKQTGACHSPAAFTLYIICTLAIHPEIFLHLLCRGPFCTPAQKCQGCCCNTGRLTVERGTQEPQTDDGYQKRYCCP